MVKIQARVVLRRDGTFNVEARKVWFGLFSSPWQYAASFTGYAGADHGLLTVEEALEKAKSYARNLANPTILTYGKDFK